jgi:GNAT superfamily N-acetyltransferase
MEKMWRSPEYIAKMDAIRRSPEYREKQALARYKSSITPSKPHRKVCSILDSLNVVHEIDYPLGPYNFDIFIPSHNILIEVQGDYWHNLPKTIRNDKAKATYASQYSDLKLYYVWEHECLQEERILEKVKYWLGLTKLELVDFEFNQLQVKRVEDFKQVDEFLYTWHYQYSGRHGTDYGVYLGDLLVATVRFTSPTRRESATSLGYKQQEVLELARLCIHPRYQKKNLATWLLARTRKQLSQERPDIKCLISFADSTHSHFGTIYKADNWELDRVVAPNYIYIDVDGHPMHKKTLWDHSKSLKMTESQYAEQKGYTKVWGKEKYKFIKNLR